MLRSTSALNPAAAGDPVPASARAVKLTSPIQLTLGDKLEFKCRLHCPSLKPLWLPGWSVAPKLKSPNPARFRLGRPSDAPAGDTICVPSVEAVWIFVGGVAGGVGFDASSSAMRFSSCSTRVIKA